MYILIHNDNCSKSNAVFNLLTEAKVAFEVRNYLTHPLNETELSILLDRLNLPAIDIIRTNESLWVNNYAEQTLNDAELIKILALHPILLQRPILYHENGGVIGRPIENITAYLQLNI